MAEVLYREAVYLWHYFSIQFGQIVGYWALGIALGSVISVFGKVRIHQLLESLQKRKLGAFGVVPASIIGIASPLCMYGTIPIAASFSQKGVKDDWLASFMMSSVLLNPQLIIYSAALGGRALTVRIVTCFVCGIAAGLLVSLFYSGKERSFFNFSGFEESTSRDTDPNMLLRLLKNIWRNVKTTGPYFLIGVALSAAFQRYIPEDWMVTLFGNNKAFGLLMAAAVGVPLYACGGGTIPLLRWWLADGMTLGGAAAFMITGPATKITNLGALKIVLGVKNFLLYIVFTVAFAFLSGLLVDILFAN
jgi:uncharacterized membrane protein YraQ (UPF0718 family)